MKGFHQKEGDHHYFIFRTAEGKKTAVFTKTSHGTGYRTIGDPLLGQMAKQCKLTKARFLELVDCTLTGEAYEAFLEANGHI